MAGAQLSLSCKSDPSSQPLRACPLHDITAWDPQLPTSNTYLWESLNKGPSGAYIWDYSPSGSSGITSVQVAPPIDSSVPYQKGPDYSGSYTTSLDFCGDDVSLVIPSPGVYAVQVNFASGGPYLEFLWAGAEQGDDAQGVENGRPKNIGIPTAFPGAFAIEIPKSERGNPGYDATAALIMPTSVRTTSVQDAMTKLNTAFANNSNRPIMAVMVGHGNTSQINVGKAQASWAGNTDGLYLLDNIQWVQNFCNGVNGVAGLNGRIVNLFLLTCDVGKNYPNNPNHLLKSLANGLHMAGGTAVTVEGYDREVWGVVAGPRRGGHFETATDATLVSVTAG